MNAKGKALKGEKAAKLTDNRVCPDCGSVMKGKDCPKCSKK